MVESKMNILIFVAIAIIPVLILTAIPGVYASDINCSEEPNHELCNGERGRSGMTFCDLAGIPEDGDCYNRDYSQINCDEDPEHSRCVGTTGLDGLIFCDEDPEADPCYDRRTN
jgi:hypothetical protein